MRYIRCLLVILLLLPGAARAQGASGTDVLRGRVTGEDGAPVPGALVEVWPVDSGVRRSATTNEQGWYTVTVPDGGGRYRVRVSRLGMTPAEMVVARRGDEEVLTRDVRLASRPVEVGGVAARARRAAPSTRADAGAQSRGLSGDLTSRLPLENADAASLAALAPGVVASGDSLGGAGSFSVLGQRGSQNQVTLDGATFASLLSGGAPGGSPLGLPQEGMRSTQVVTNTYDVARGQFSGGQVAMTTRAGTSTTQGSLSYRLGGDLLQGGAGRGAWSGGFAQNRVSAGVAGPLVRDRLFYSLSLAAQQRSDGLYTLAPRAPEGFSALGVSADSVARFLDVLERVHGVRVAGQTGAFTRTTDALSTLARVDYSPTARHTASLRGYTSHSRTDNALIRPLELLENGAASSSRAFGAVATLSSRLGDAWINELRASASTDAREFTPALHAPDARVQVASALEAGGASVATLSFGGDPFPPRATRERTAEVANELSLLVGGTHRIKAGASFGHTAFEQRDAVGSNGVFAFASLADLEAGRPASFSRTLAGAATRGSGWSAALYLGDTWRPTEALQLVYGARVEASGFGEAPARGATADSAFGLRTDRTPREVHASPRLGFSWRLPGGRPRSLRGGIGEFRGRTPFSLYAGVLDAGRGAAGESFVSCVGAGRVPAPDFRAFRADPASVPTACADGSAGVPASAGRPNVTAFAPGFESPRSWRASLGYEHTLRPRLTLAVDGFYLRGVGQYGVRDLNLAPAPAFTLAAEGGRPVYAPASSIDPATGAVPLFASRRDARFAHAYEVHSDLRSESAALTVALTGMLPSLRANFQTSYTLSRTRDQSSFAFGGPREGFDWTMTDGDPNRPSWAAGDQDRRHALSAVVGRPLGNAWEVSLIGRATSGAPYTPRVAGDINGDGAGNDAAFVADPAGADPELGAALRRVMDAAPGHAAECLRGHFGRVVPRNGCRGAWEYSLDARLGFTPTAGRLGRRLSLGVDVRNVAAGADLLLHGSDGVRGWGQGGRATDNVLLYPRGFDPAGGFGYQVNERFGQVRSRAAALGSPFAVQLTGRVQVGPNPERDLWGGFIGLGAREGAVRITEQSSGPPPEGAGPGRRIQTGPAGGGGVLDRLLPFPIQEILARRDSLGLSAEQVARLDTIRAELEEKNIPIRAEVGAALGGTGGAPGNPAAVFERVGPRLNEGRQNVQRALDQARAVLTPEQWSRVPDRVRNAVEASSIRVQGT
jgi:hypothetical protein